MPDTYVDPCSSPEFVEKLDADHTEASLRDAFLNGARTWEVVRDKVAEEVFTRIFEFDDASKELLAKRCEDIAERCVAHMRDYSAVPDAPDASAQYSAFEQSHRRLVMALVAGRMGMALTRALEVAPSGKARVAADLFDVEMELGEDGTYSPRWAAEHTQQQVRAGRVAWVGAYARIRGNEGLAPEEVRELERILSLPAADMPITDSNMRTVDYLFERLQPGWSSLSTEDGRRELLASERDRARDACRNLLRDFPDRWNEVERTFLAELPARPDADLVPPVVAEVHRLHARELARDAQKLARDRIAEVAHHMPTLPNTALRSLTENERKAWRNLFDAPADRDLTAYELSDAELLHDKVLTIVEGA